MAELAGIYLYPFKSLDVQQVSSASVLPSGALEFDRRWAIVDQQGDPINGKRFPVVHQLRSTFDLSSLRISLRDVANAREATFHIDDERSPLEAWLSEFFGQSATVIENAAGGFPDDTEFPGPTVISTASLEAVARWYPGLSLDSSRKRFRANLEIGGVEPFWEDRLLAPGLGVVRFRIGDAELQGMNPCARCVVPSRDPQTGEVTPLFAKTFAGARLANLPQWAAAQRFDHYYRLSVNTQTAAGTTQQVHVGDAVEVLGVE